MKVFIGKYPTIHRKVTLVGYFFDWVLGRDQRKVSVRIDPQDTWNMDDTLAFIILPMLKQLKETKQGSPSVDDEDVPEELRSTNATSESWYGVDGNHHARWDWVLEEIIWAFEQKCHHLNDIFITENPEDDDYKFDVEKMEERQKRMTNGFRLFGKYYECLWT